MKKRILCLFLVLVMAVGILASCGPQNPPEDDDPTETCTHVDADHNGKCDKCKKKIGNAQPHKDDDHDDKCDLCGKAMTSGGGDDGDDEEGDFPWDDTTLKYQMTDNSNGKQLSSGCRRYMSGELSVEDKPMAVDAMVTERNTAALTYAKVTVNYDYCPDTSAYGWGANIETITTDTHSGNSNTPDIYCNFVYDMIGASLKASFANLKSTARQSTLDNGNNVDDQGANYFDFMDAKYGEDVITRYNQYSEQVGDRGGYMLEYMNSLTLSQTKMYLLASDYYLDLIRAFFIIPVNVEMYNSLSGVDSSVHYDRNDDGVVDILDFTKMVIEDGDWTYDTVIKYCDVFTHEGAQTSINDPKIGLAVTNGSMQAAGFLYTTNITIIHKEPKSDGSNDFDYYYPELNALDDPLYVFTDKLGQLFTATNGILSVSGGQNQIRTRFGNGDILFGDVMCIGALAENEYQGLKKENGEGGFAIAPVPVYDKDAQDEYLTQIHNIGRIGAIASCSTKFAQASAFLNYQSTHSTEIRDYYYDITLKYDVSDGTEYNIDLIDYIRYHVRSSFDKAYEDAIGIFAKTQDPTSVQNKWHEMITTAHFNLTDLREKYASMKDVKQGHLDNMYNTCYPNLPD